MAQTHKVTYYTKEPPQERSINAEDMLHAHMPALGETVHVQDRNGQVMGEKVLSVVTKIFYDAAFGNGNIAYDTRIELESAQGKVTTAEERTDSDPSHLLDDPDTDELSG